MKIIPAIDIIDGKCVRLSQGDYTQKKIYNENPLEVAKMFEESGLKHLHLVDLDGAKAGKVVNWKVIETITGKTKLTVDFGGGIKTAGEITNLLNSGVAQINLGSIAVKNPSLVMEWLSEFGPETIILSADVKDEVIQISGWIENSALRIDDFVQQFLPSGLKTVTCTDIATDGMLTGPNISLYKNLIANFPKTDWIASGGVSGSKDLIELKRTGVAGVIIGKAIYEGRITLNELQNF
jgi:phosphoribosylformimino-5-aminoimidazole carboxamide ribotide isomerase